MLRTTLFCAALLSVSAGLLPGHARASIAPLPDTMTESADLRGLDLTRNSDWNEARHRVHRTAIDVCSKIDISNGTVFRTDQEACVTDGETNALRQLESLRETARSVRAPIRTASTTAPHA